MADGLCVWNQQTQVHNTTVCWSSEAKVRSQCKSMVGYWMGIRIVEKRHCWDHIFTAMENLISRTGFITNGLFLQNVVSTKSYILRCAESIYWEEPASCQKTVLLISSSGECINPVPVRYYYRPNTARHILMRCVCLVASVMRHRYINLPRKTCWPVTPAILTPSMGPPVWLKAK